MLGIKVFILFLLLLMGEERSTPGGIG